MADILGTNSDDSILPSSLGGVSPGVTGGIPSSAADTISALDGNDTINGGSGNDTLIGGAGNDIFQVQGTQAALDTFDGGLGIDKIVNLNPSTNVTFNREKAPAIISDLAVR
jgi:Ca2+-binding RTX toxin-like protein